LGVKVSDTKNNNRLIPLVLAGGTGTDLWPLERTAMPKQFLPLFGGRSSFQRTLQLVSDPALFKQPIVVTAPDIQAVAVRQAKEAGVEADLVLASLPSSSCTVIAAAVALIEDKDAVVSTCPADRIVPDERLFLDALGHAGELARGGRIVALGDGGSSFVFRPGVLLGELKRVAPELFELAVAAISGPRQGSVAKLNLASNGSAGGVPLAEMVAGMVDQLAVVPAPFPSADIGSWEAVMAASERNEEGNSMSGAVGAIASRDCYIRSDGRYTAVVGLKDVAVVSTADAVLVTSRSAAPEVRKLIAGLGAEQSHLVDQHVRSERPWGWYQEIDRGDRFRVKRIVVEPGARLSLQKHHHRAEHWVVVRGTAEVTIENTVQLVHENQSVFIPFGNIHRLGNPGRIPVELIEVQTGSYLEEDDIIRVEDIYQRT
jgi:mannose-1-phosphate guanylyltransferase/mannose-6-phosphate isomerase